MAGGDLWLGVRAGVRCAGPLRSVTVPCPCARRPAENACGGGDGGGKQQHQSQVLRDRQAGTAVPGASHGAPAVRLTRSSSSWSCRDCLGAGLCWAPTSGRRPGGTWRNWWSRTACRATVAALVRARLRHGGIPGRSSRTTRATPRSQQRFLCLWVQHLRRHNVQQLLQHFQAQPKQHCGRTAALKRTPQTCFWLTLKLPGGNATVQCLTAAQSHSSVRCLA